MDTVHAVWILAEARCVRTEQPRLAASADMFEMHVCCCDQLSNYGNEQSMTVLTAHAGRLMDDWEWAPMHKARTTKPWRIRIFDNI